MDKVVLNVAVSIVLVALYIYFFGQHSVQKFLNKSVIITENEEKQDAISPPAITISPINPKSGKGEGWKILDGLNLCNNVESGEQFKHCVEEKAYSVSDTSTNAYCVLCKPFNATVTMFYQADFSGLVQSLRFNRRGVSDDISKTVSIILNSSIAYSVFISDPKLQLWMPNPHTIPRTYLSLQESAGYVTVYIKAIRHEKLNRPHKPCQTSPDYSFAECVERSIVARAGCQPPWRRFNVEGVSQCDNSSMLTAYGKKYSEIGKLAREKLIETTKCLIPCIYMEYQMTEEPEVIESNNMTVLGPIIFATASVQVLREEEAFTFGSLVADCGGVLGLFVGFNFLMVWDWLVLFVGKLTKSFYSLGGGK